jgi:predicted transcriptional regulator
MDAIKIVFIGQKGVGKSTLRKILFEQESPIKLLQDSLEPTYGVETNVYDIGSKMAIHDLAGQQLNEWLEESQDIMIDSDLIFLILDPQKDWLENYSLFEKITRIRDELCPESFLGVFLHKKDLLSEEKLVTLEKHISTIQNITDGVLAYGTSIKAEFFLETFNAFVAILRKCLVYKEENDMSQILAKMSILNQFIGKSKLTIQELLVSLDENPEDIHKILENLNLQGLMVVKDGADEIELTDKGAQLLDKIKKKMILNIETRDIINSGNLKGLIITDNLGNSILKHETEENFFQNLKSDGKSDVNIQMISIFLTGLTNFGKVLSNKGFNEVILNGDNLKSVVFNYRKFVFIFFLEDIDIGKEIINALRMFTEDIEKNFKTDLIQFFKLNVIKNMDNIQSVIVDEVKSLNQVIENYSKIKPEISREELAQIYVDIEQENIERESIIHIKKIIFEYILRNEPALLNEIQTIINERNN